jgi:hypothetical protein
MLGQMEHPMYGLDKKISIDMPGMPSINDLMFSTLMQALLEDLPIAITVKTPEGSEQDHEGIPRCRIPDDCIDSKRYPLFMAREVMRQLIDNLCVTTAVHPGALS